jgi:cytochrome c oxidase assembly protein subunit 15
MSDQTAARERRLRWVRYLALAATIGMFLVIVMGATVTNTGSGEGCGRSWPLCHGRFIPTFAVATLIEFSHRFVTGIEGILLLALSAGALIVARQRREVQVLVPLTLFTLILQSGLGAWAVLRPQHPLVMALHFGVSLTAFASVLLLSVVLWDRASGDSYRDRPLPSGMTALIWSILLFTYLVVYLGAYVRHSNANLACLDWPLCRGSLLPSLHGAVGAVVLHRGAAFIDTILIALMVVWAWRLRSTRPDIWIGSLLALISILAQSASGAFVVFSRMQLFSTLSHSAIVTLLFGFLSYLVLHTLPRPAMLRMERSLHHAVAPAAGGES